MILKEIADIAELICPGWEQHGEEVFKEVLEAAQRIYGAGYRLPDSDPQ